MASDLAVQTLANLPPTGAHRRRMRRLRARRIDPMRSIREVNGFVTLL